MVLNHRWLEVEVLHLLGLELQVECLQQLDRTIKRRPELVGEGFQREVLELILGLEISQVRLGGLILDDDHVLLS